MNPLEPDFRLEHSGDDVKLLHVDLDCIGLAVPAIERQQSLFGPGTQEAVLRFQREHGLEPTGVVDAETARAITEAAVAAAAYTVSGTVTSPDRADLVRLAVCIVDRNVGQDVTLAEAVTGDQGRYRVRFGTAALRARGKDRPDLQARVLVGGAVVAASEVRYDADASETLDVALPAGVRGLPSELEALTGAIARHYPGRLEALQESGDRQDITYLADKTGWDAVAVALAALADRLHDASQGALAAPWFYALLRAGLPADPASLYQADTGTVAAIWKQAIGDGVIPAHLEPEIPAALRAFQQLADARALDVRAVAGTSTLDELLRPVLGEAAQRRRFAELQARHRDDPPGLWAEAEAAFGAETARRLQLDGELAALTLNNAAVIGRLHQAEAAAPLSSVLDLVRRGYHRAERWRALIDDTVPASIPGATPDDRRTAYAELLAAKLRAAFPTAVVAEQVRSGALPLEAAAGVHGFLAEHQGTFELGAQPIERYLASQGLADRIDPQVKDQLQRLQRVYRLTTQDPSMAALLRSGVHSAAQVVRHKEPEFLARFQDAMGGEGAAQQVYRRAQQVHGATLGAAVGYLAARNAPTLGTNGMVLGGAALVNRPDTAAGIASFPTLEGLFGSMDYCGCTDCRSILSPAAYLVDLLQFTENRTPRTGANPQAVLLARRPDIAHLPLTCENTNTAIPYIDVVNETLEYFVARGSLTGYAGHDTGGRETSAELLASPPFVDDTAYTALAAAYFPAPLPFHRSLELLRRWFRRFQVALPDALAALRTDDAIERKTAAAYGWRDILMERLGLSRTEHQILTNADLAAPLTLAQLYGQAPATADADVVKPLYSFQVFSRQIGITYDELVRILATRFVNPGVSLLPRLRRLGVPLATLQQLANGTIAESDFEALVARASDPPDIGHYGGSFKTWVDQNRASIMGLIVLADTRTPPDPCAVDKLVLSYAGPDADPTKNTLLPFEYLRMLRFIRLWKKLGWTIEQTDKAITALYPASKLPAPPTATNFDANRKALDEGFLVLLPRLGAVRELMDRLGMTPDDLPGLLAAWSTLDTQGDDALYRTLFLRPPPPADSPFADNGYGDVLPDPTRKLLSQGDAIRAAFGLARTDLAQITAVLGFDATTPLTLDNLSQIYRRGWLARRLGVSVEELLSLLRWTGIDPFHAPDPVDPAAASAPPDPRSPPRPFASPDPTRPGMLRLVQLVQALSAASLPTAQALSLIWNQALTGSAAPDDTAPALARTLRGASAAVDAALAVADDPNGDLARARLALVYGAEATDRLFSLLDGTLFVEVPYTSATPTLDPGLLQIAPGLAYDGARRVLSYQGTLTPAIRDALKAAPAVSAAFQAAVDALYAPIEQFFARYPDLRSPFTTYIASADPPAQKRAALLAATLAEIIARRKREQALAAVAAAATVSVPFAETIVGDAAVLHAAIDAAQPALDDVLALGTPGLSANFYASSTATGFPGFSVDAVPMLDYSATGPARLPANPTPGATISGVWSGYLEAPETTDYTFSVETDAGVIVTLSVADRVVVLIDPNNANAPNNVVALAAGAPVAISLTVENVTTRVALRWATQARGQEVIPSRYLYSATLTGRLRNAQLRLGKAAALAAALALTAAEIAHVARDPAYHLVGGMFLGQGWLNALPVAGDPDAWTAQGLRDVLGALLDLARIKAALAPGSDRLLAVLQDPANAESRLLSLTGWEPASLDALLAQFGATGTALARVDTLRRVHDAYALVRTLGVPAAALVAAATNDPGAQTIADLRSAIRARFDEDSFLAVLRPMFDELRALQRDALVAHILHGLSLTRGSTSDLSAIDTPDKLFELLLMDVETAPNVQTSRIRHALSSVQLFIERCLMNLELEVSPSSLAADQWEWMKRYRVWQANREVFLWPENWLEPELRDDQSPFFREALSELLQGDITEDAAATAMLNYLTKLEEVAKLEPSSLCYIAAGDGQPDVTHVVARTAGAQRKYFYRRREGLAWTPWEQIKLDIEDDPLCLAVWNGRLLLFWLRIVKQSPTTPQVPSSSNGSLAALTVNDVQRVATTVTVQAVLCWSEYYNGKWQAAKTSDINAPTKLGVSSSRTGDLDRSILALDAVEERYTSLPAALRVNITSKASGSLLGSSFLFYNTHSLPVRAEDAPPTSGRDPDAQFRWLHADATANDASGLLWVDYLPGPGGPESSFSYAVLGLNLAGDTVGPHSPWVAPFLFEDSRNVFFVTTEQVAPGLRAFAASPSPVATPAMMLRSPVRGAISSGPPSGSGAARAVTALVRSRTDIAPAGAPMSAGPGSSNGVAMLIAAPDAAAAPIFKYTFELFSHPYIGELIAQVNRRSLAGLLDPVYQAGLTTKGFFAASYTPRASSVVTFGAYPEKTIDVTLGGPYANYNWELCFHFPLAIAVHLSKNQRFAEAQRWFHYIFDPTCNDTSVAPPQRFWKFLAFRDPADAPVDIAELLALLADPAADPTRKARILAAYDAIKAHPFEPHAVARSRIAAYQYAVVMKYLDNLIAWGDSLFVQDTIESINEATQRYVLAANILGPRPQQSPARGEARSRSFADLEAADPTGNALVDLEGQFPFDFPAPSLASPAVGPLFGIGRTLYFCVPRNDKLLGYWDTVGDRLFKIRHSMNIDGVVQQLPLFDPPIDPVLLVKAAAAGIDVAAALDASNQPIGPARAPAMIQKAAELAAEVRSLGGGLLSALEKGDAEHLSRLRQGQEIKLLQLTQDTRFLQWKQAEAATESLLRTRESALERYHYYQRLLGLKPDDNAAPTTFLLDRVELTEKNFDEMFGNLVGKYARPIAVLPYPPLQLAGGASPANQAGAAGIGQLYLNTNEDAELNTHLPAARDTRVLASATELLAQVFSFIPDFSVNLEFWGLGGTAVVFGGSKLAASAHAVGEVLRIASAWEQDQAGLASRTAGYQRRADDWMQQSNLAARELMQIGRQLIGSLIAEQIARHEYQAVQTQIENATQIDDFLATKFTGEQRYAYLSGELSRLYYAYYRFALDTARKAERTMKRELMRPELDATEYIQVNYWDSGRRGLMSGERLHLDIKRMELAYLDSNQRELEITRHVSLRQLDPLALLSLRIHGSCQITIPEWLYDRDCPGHYLRRIKTVALSLPAVVGPYASVNCTLTLLRSTIRRSPLLTQTNKYARTGTDDPRFLDSFGAAQSIVTSSGTNDSGLFETNLRDDRFLPFEGAGAMSTWQLALPETFRPFDYFSLSDAILHIRYTARSGGAALAEQAVNEVKTVFAASGTSALLFSLRHDFPGEWAAFMNSDSAPFTVTLQNTFFPYLAQTRKLTINSLELYDAALTRSVLTVALTGDINQGSATLQVPVSDPVLTRTATQVFLIVRYSFTA